MERYLFCYDESARQGTPVRYLTPRAVFWAESRAEAREAFERAIALIRPRFGVAGFRKEWAREHARLVCPCDRLPTLDAYLDRYEPLV